MSVPKLIVALTLMVAVPATIRLHAQQKAGASTREQTVMAAQSYLEGGMTLHLPKSMALAPDVWRIENGWETGHDAQGLRDAMAANSGVRSIRMIKWVVQGNEAAVFSEVYAGRGRIATGHYFKVTGGNIKEILLAFSSQQPPGNSRNVGAPMRANKPLGNPLVDIADNFLKGIEKGDLSDAKVGPDISITENNEMKAESKDAALEYWRQNWLGTITKVTVMRWLVEGPDVVALYQADRREGRPLWVSQYFRIYDGLVRETWATFGAGPTDAEKAAAGTAQNRK